VWFEHVERLAPQLEVQALEDAEVAEDAKILAIEARSDDRSAPRVAGNSERRARRGETLAVLNHFWRDFSPMPLRVSAVWSGRKPAILVPVMPSPPTSAMVTPLTASAGAGRD